MSAIEISAERTLTVENGKAYGLVAGGAVAFVPAHYGWFTGANYTQYAIMLYSMDVAPPMIFALLQARAALAHAAQVRPAELGGIVEGGLLQLSAAEVLDDDAVHKLVNWKRLDRRQCDGGAHLAPAQNELDMAGPYVLDRIPDVLFKAFNDPDVKMLADSVCRMSYTVAAVNAYGLITSSHHLRGAATGLATNIMKLYEVDALLRNLGVDSKESLQVIFHHLLHPLSYERVAAWGQAIPEAAGAKVAAQFSKRLPAYPGGTAFAKNAGKCLLVITGATALKGMRDGIEKSAGVEALDALNKAVIAAPLDYSQAFRPTTLAAKSPEIARAKTVAAAIFGIYDAWKMRNIKRPTDGPTSGDGMVHFIEEYSMPYTDARDATLLFLEREKDAAKEEPTAILMGLLK